MDFIDIMLLCLYTPFALAALWVVTCLFFGRSYLVPHFLARWFGRDRIRRAAMTLALMLLTTTAWAFKTEGTVSYTLSSNFGSIPNTSYATMTISGGGKSESWRSSSTFTCLWAKDEFHNLANGMTITPSDHVTVLSSQSTVSANTTFTFTAPSNIAITGVQFKMSTANVAASSTSEPGSTFTVTFNKATVFNGFEVTYGYISGSCGSSATWTLSKPNGQYTALTISGSGDMQDYSYTTENSLWRTNAPWDWQDLKSVTIRSGITKIGNYAFIGCQQLSSLTIGSGVTTIGTNAFDHCDGLTTVTLPASVCTLNDAAFKNCTALTRVNIEKSNGLVTLGSNGFNGTALQTIVVPTPTLALQYQSASNWSGYASKLRVPLGSQLFTATNVGGTAAYAITNETDLRNFSAAVNEVGSVFDKTFRQTAHITLNGPFTPIGSSAPNTRMEGGTYDGGGNVISGLNVSGSGFVGLFSNVYQGTIKNVVLMNPSFPDLNTSAALIGRLNGGTALNCYAYGTDKLIADQKENPTVTNVGRASKVTVGSGLESVTPAATDMANGFIYNNDNYYREGLQLTLNSSFSAPTGQHIVYKSNNNTLDGNNFTVGDSDVTLTAELAYNTYTVHFDGNGATGGTMSDQAFTYGTAQELTANAFTRTGCTFAGWATTDNGEVVYTDQQSVSNLTETNGYTVTLYAKWFKPEPESLPYSYGFDDETLPIGWTTYKGDTYNSSIDIRDGALAFQIGNNNYLMAVLPEFDAAYSLNEYQVSFDACYANFSGTYMTSGKLAIGVMTNPNELITFKQLKEVDITDVYPTYGRHTVRLNHYTGTGNYIAIKNSYVRNGYILIDNIEVTPLPAYLEPTDLTVATTAYDATITWQNEAADVSYDIALSTTETDHPEDFIVGQTTATTYNLSSPDIQFGDNYVYVRTNYGQTGYSAWVGKHFVIGYGAPYITSRDEDGIIGVKFGSGEHVVNISDPDGLPSAKPFYGDYSNLVGDIEANTDATIEITTNTGEYYSYVYAIWIDLNKNLLFEDNELLWIDEAADGDATINATITIPANTPAGDYRMRIYGADDYFNEFFNNGIINWDAPHDACYDAEWANACDFTVHVVAAPYCRPPFELATTINIDESHSGKFKADLHWTSNSATPETDWTLYWKKSSDAAYTSVSVSGSPTYTLSGLDTETAYEFYLTAHMEVESEPVTSTPSKVCHFTTPHYPVSAPWSEDFNSLTEDYSIPDGWDNSEGTIKEASYKWCYINETYDYGACNGTSHDGSNCVRFNSVDPDRWQNNYLKSVPIKLPEDTPMKLTFWYKNPWGGDYSVFISTDGGNTCNTVLFSGLKATNWTQTHPIYLHRFRGQMVTLVFKGTSNYGADDSFLYLDDVEVSVAPEYAAPVVLSATDVTPHSAVLNWKGNTESAWTVCYKKASDSEYTSIANVTAKPYTLENLDAYTNYQFHVVANYPENHASEPSAEYTFRTLFEPITITADRPYTEDFETTVGVESHNASGHHMPGGWEIVPDGDDVYNTAKVLINGASRNYMDDESDNQVVYFYGKGYNFAALPLFTNNLRSLEVSFKYAFESLQGDGHLTLGFIFPGDIDYNTFDTISYITPDNQNNFQAKKTYEVVKNLKYEVPDRATRLVFRWYNKLQWGCNVDAIEVKLRSDNHDKNIVGYADDRRRRWYLIARPWYGEEAVEGIYTHFTNNTYDLYRFDPGNANGLEWENYKVHKNDAVNPFESFVNGQAYLYANSNNVTLNFWGQPYIGDREVTLKKEEGTVLSGWNLIGNPYTETTYIGKPYYRMNDDGSGLVAAAANTPIEPAEGIFVYADYDGEVVTFTTDAQKYADAASNGTDGLPAIPLVLPTHGLSADQDATVRYTIALNNDGITNASTIEEHHGHKADVTLQNRTLWKDGDWNTLCLPFGLTATQVETMLENPSELKELDITNKWSMVNGQWTIDENGTYQTKLTDDGTLHLYFKDATKISAGVPYIIKWAGGSNLVNPVFTGVTIVGTSPVPARFSGGKFVGNYDYLGFTEENKSILFLGAHNTLFWPQSGASIGAFRTYFELTDGQQAREFSLNFGDSSERTGILSNSKASGSEGVAAWFSLDGRRLSDQPAKAGIYIRNRRKIVVK